MRSDSPQLQKYWLTSEKYQTSAAGHATPCFIQRANKLSNSNLDPSGNQP